MDDRLRAGARAATADDAYFDAAAARAALHGAECVHSAAAVQSALDAQAAALTTAVGDDAPVLLAVMTGGLWPTVELSRRLEFAHRVDCVHATRYEGARRGATVRWRLEPRLALSGQCVVIVDDILDEGHTIAAVQAACRDAGAARVLTTVLVRKQHARLAPGVAVDFVALEVPDRYVFGCGMDLHEYWRGLPAIYAVGEDGR